MIPFFNLHTHIIDNENDSINILNVYPDEELPENQYYSTGIHPWKINENWQQELEIIEKRLLNKNCLALGECGIDKRIKIPIDLQIEIFEAQVIIAKKHKKPLLLHCVAGFDEIIQVLNQQNFKEKVIFHGFSKSEQLAKQLIEKGFYLSFGKYLLEKKELADVFKNIDNNHFFLETDNSKYTLNQVYEKACEIKKMNLEEMKKIVFDNFKKKFEL